ERTVASVAAVRLSYGGDGIGVRAGREPVDQLGADRPALVAAVGRIDRPRLAGHHQHQPHSRRAGPGEAAFETAVRLIEREPVEIEGEIGFLRAGFEAAFPVRVEPPGTVPGTG